MSSMNKLNSLGNWLIRAQRLAITRSCALGVGEMSFTLFRLKNEMIVNLSGPVFRLLECSTSSLHEVTQYLKVQAAILQVDDICDKNAVNKPAEIIKLY